MVDKVVVSKLYLSTALVECGDNINFKAFYYMEERDFFGDELPIEVEEINNQSTVIIIRIN